MTIPGGEAGGDQPAAPKKANGMLRRVLLGMAAGVLLALSFPPYNLPILLPLGIAALIRALDGADLREAAYTGLACGMLYFGGTLFWLANLFGVASLSLVVILACFPMLFGVISVWLRRRLSLPGWLIFPVVWTALEYYRSEPFALSFGWVGVGYGIVHTAFGAMLAPIVGSYGITFVIVLLASLLAEPALLRWRPLVPALIWLTIVLFPAPASDVRNPVHVRLVQAYGEDTDSLFKFSQPTSTFRPDIIVWPEYSLNSDPTRSNKLLRNSNLWPKLQQVAIVNHAYFLFGAKAIPDPRDDDHFRNTAYLLDPTGTLIARHVKNHLVHFIRDGIPGTDARAVPTSIGRLGVGICFDMDYPDVAQRLAADGAEYLLVPNMDPAEWGSIQRAQHRLMFQMRAAECGRWLARADVAGGTSVCDAHGRMVAIVSTSDPIALDVTIGRASGKTLFVLGGWRFGQLCLLLTALACVWSLFGKRKDRGEGSIRWA